MPEVVVLSGGVGGARFVRGLVGIVPPEEVTVVGNVGDDVEVLGLHVSPDLDSLVYALADLHDEERGWGRRDETWNALATARELGDPDTWFQLGDRDIGLHLVRTRALRSGEPLSAVTARIAASLGVRPRLLPASDDRLRTIVETAAGPFSLQEWFVRRGHRDVAEGVRFDGAEDARPAPGVLEAIAQAALVVIAPSNPFISIWPILAVGAIRDAVREGDAPVVGVSPVIGGKAVKGPADAMLASLAGGTTAAHVARCYDGLLDALVVDEEDAGGAPEVEALGVRVHVTRTLMSDAAAARALAQAVLEAAGR
jgi:LPPG:FO 2-phospho-L-lactate transferase